MRRLCGLCVLVLGASSGLAHAGGWPTKLTFDNGTELGVKGALQYDGVGFSGDRLPNGQHLFRDTKTWRTQTFAIYLKHPDDFNAQVAYDFNGDTWLDNDLSIHTPAGRFKVGEFRTLVGWESEVTLGESTSFMESALPVLVIDEGRRAGIGWTWTGMQHFTLQAQWFAPHDLNHDGDGQTIVGRVVYAPIKRETDVVHLGLSASRETRENGKARFRARPETHLTPVRLVDTGELDDVNHIDRAAVEAGWMRGPLLVQAEYLDLRADRATTADFHGHGGFVAVNWMLTGESRVYKNTTFVDPKVVRRWGALEASLRYSRVDLDDGAVQGGIEHNWTFGVDWYINQHFKLQANDIYAVVERGDRSVSPNIYELRAQLSF